MPQIEVPDHQLEEPPDWWEKALERDEWERERGERIIEEKEQC